MKNNIYTAEATATGGRSGHVRSTDGVIDMPMSAPGAPGKTGATNPEQLFAAGYASCFQQALIVVSQRRGERLDPASTVQCSVTLFKDGDAFGLSAVLDVNLAGVDPEKAADIVHEAHQICPYSVGTRGNMEVELRLNGEPAPTDVKA